MTPEKEARLAQLAAEFGPSYAPPADTGGGFWSRFGQGLANVPGDVAQSIISPIQGALGLAGIESGNPDVDHRLYQLDAPQNMRETLADIGSGAASVIAQSLLPGGVVRRGAGLLGAGPRLAAIAGDVGAGAYLGAQQSPEEAAIMGGEFGAMGAISQALPGGGIKKALLRTVLNASIPPASAAIRGEDPFTKGVAAQSLAQGVLGEIGSATARRSLFRKAPETPTIIPDEVIPPERGQLALPGPTTAPSGRTWNMLEWPHGDARTFSPSSEPIPLFRLETGMDISRNQGPIQEPFQEADVSGVPGLPIRQRAEPRVEPMRSLEPSGEILSQAIEYDPLPPYAPAGLFRKLFTTEPSGLQSAKAQETSPESRSVVEPRSRDWDAYVNEGLNPDDALMLKAEELEGKLQDLAGPTGGGVVESLQMGQLKGSYSFPQYVDKLQEAFDKLSKSGPPKRLFRRRSASESGAVGGTGFRPSSDFEQYTTIKNKMDAMLSDGSAFAPNGSLVDEFNRLWQEREVIKNRNNGMPPSAPSESGAMPFPLVAHLGSGALSGGIGYATAPEGATEDERRARAAMFAVGGLVAPSAGRALFRGLKAAGGAVERKAGLSGESGQSGVVMSPAGKRVLRAISPKLEPKLEEAARETERNRPSLLGKATRFVERNVTAAQPEVQTAQELGKGFQHDLSERATVATEKLAPVYNRADPKELAAIEAFNQSKGTGASWSPAEESRLRAAIGNDAADNVLELRRIEEQAQTTVKESAAPKREKLLEDTLGTYDTRAFRAFLTPEKWQQDLVANPAKRDAAINALASHPAFKGLTREDMAEAVDTYGANIARKARGEATEGQAKSSKIDQFLFTHRKELGPEVLDYLGEVKNPIEKRVLTVAKLLKSAAQAKTMSELLKMDDGKGNRLVLDKVTRANMRDAAVARGDTETADALRGYQEIPDAEGFGKMAGMMAPREVIDALNAHREVMSSGYDKMLSTINNVIKQSLTVANPATHIRNWAQILTQGLIARVYNPVRYVEAIKVLRDKRDMWRKMVRLNIAGADYTSAELHSSAADLEEFLNPTGNKLIRGAKRAGKAVQKFYGLPDNVTRIAAYLENEPRFLSEGSAKGLTGDALKDYAEKATQQFVNRYTWNYGAVSPLVKWARNKPLINPFISYTAEMGRILKNLGEDVLMGDAKTKAWATANLTQLLALPAILAAAGEQTLSEKDQKDWQTVDKLGPSYLRSQIKMPIGRNRDGTFRYINLSPLVSAGDFFSTAKNLAKGDWEALIGNNPVIGIDKTPAINLAATLINREDRFTGQKVKTAGDVANVVTSSVAPPWVPGVGFQGKRLLRAITPNQEGGLGLTDSRTGRQDIPSTVIPNLLGVPVSSANPKVLFRRAQVDAQEALIEAKSELRKILSTNASQEVKQKALLKFQQKAKEIQEQRQALLSP